MGEWKLRGMRSEGGKGGGCIIFVLFGVTSSVFRGGDGG